MVNFAYAPLIYDFRPKVTNFTERTHIKISSLLENYDPLLILTQV